MAKYGTYSVPFADDELTDAFKDQVLCSYVALCYAPITCFCLTLNVGRISTPNPDLWSSYMISKSPSIFRLAHRWHLIIKTNTCSGSLRAELDGVMHIDLDLERSYMVRTTSLETTLTAYSLIEARRDPQAVGMGRKPGVCAYRR